ncbi:hypothetical protein [Paramicrobacterium fandaimingii]|uniref:hypothetical protein n=1 Tax=Paramicrobacterium fandaimingii TaxID=2708079 RepID=UPI00141E1432|nr:hypothetical protein [Microbacterium fandaimingii]
MKRAAEWFLTLHELTLDEAIANAIHPQATTATSAETERDNEDEDTPGLYDTGLSADEGLWTRSGWAGRA